MIELINQTGKPLTDELRELQDWRQIFLSEAGVDIIPFIYDPMSGGAEEVARMEEVDDDDDEDPEYQAELEARKREIVEFFKDDFYDPAELRALVEKLLGYVESLPKVKETKLLVKELKQLLEGCDVALRAGDKVQLLADFEDREDPDYDDEEGDEETEEDEDDER